MSAHPATGIVAQECKDQHPHRMNLPFGTCIGGVTGGGKAAPLTTEELKDARQAAAAGKLANTGAGFNPFMVSTSVLAVALGGMIVYTVRRRHRHEL